MKDIEKMRAKFEEEVRLAELGNRFETEYGIEPTVFRSGGYDFIHVPSYRFTGFAEQGFENPLEEVQQPECSKLLWRKPEVGRPRRSKNHR